MEAIVSYEDVLAWVKMIFPELSEQEIENKVKEYTDMFRQASVDLATFVSVSKN